MHASIKNNSLGSKKMNIHIRAVSVSGMAIVLVLLAGCASSPSSTVADLRANIKSVTFVQHGTEPLTYKLGVVDGTSFWSNANPGTIKAPVSAAAAAAATTALNASLRAARSVEAGRQGASNEMMAWMFNKHPMVIDAGAALMPKMASMWGVPYDRMGVRGLPWDSKPENESGQFTAFQPTTDLVLVFAVSELGVSERPSVGGAFAAAFTAGFNTKHVTSATYVGMTAYKRDGAGQYQKVWSGRCGVPVLLMEVTYPFPELAQSQQKAKQLWDATTPKVVEYCSRYLERTT
jgi:hypothetical protein